MTTATHAGNFVAPTRMLADFGTMLAADIDPEKFADRCGTSINHPAFTLGHCTYYLGIAANTLGASIGCGPDEKRLYAIGVECVDTPGTYPAKDDVLAALRNGDGTLWQSCDPTVGISSLPCEIGAVPALKKTQPPSPQFLLGITTAQGGSG